MREFAALWHENMYWFWYSAPSCPWGPRNVCNQKQMRFHERMRNFCEKTLVRNSFLSSPKNEKLDYRENKTLSIVSHFSTYSFVTLICVKARRQHCETSETELHFEKEAE